MAPVLCRVFRMLLTVRICVVATYSTRPEATSLCSTSSQGTRRVFVELWRGNRPQLTAPTALFTGGPVGDDWRVIYRGGIRKFVIKRGGAGGRTRTDMRSEPRQILSLVRIPISPLRREGCT